MAHSLCLEGFAPLDRLTGGFRPYLLLSLLCLALYLPGLASVPPLDRDESRFAQATRQMLETGDYIRIQFQQEMRAKKPVGAYWLQAASVRLFSDPASTEIWPYRLPSAVAAWAAALLTFAYGRWLFGRQAALLAAGLLASSLILVAEAHQAKTDALLLACAVAAQGALGRFYMAGKGAAPAPGMGVALAFWVAIGVSILVKGPVVPAITLLTILALVIADKGGAGWLVSLRPFTGVAVAAAIAGPWFAAISQATGGAFVGEAVKGDLLPKLLGAQESHGGWPGTYLALSAVLLWPGSLLLWPALVATWGERVRPQIRFCLAWAGPAWIMFELVPTKLPHYVLPAFPALTLLMAAAVVGGAHHLERRWAKVWYGIWTLVALVLAAAVIVAPQRFGDGVGFAQIASAAGIAAIAVMTALMAVKGRLAEATMAAAVLGLVSFQTVFATILPHLDRLFVSREAAALVARLPHAGPVAVAGFNEPSLVFWLGTATRMTDAAAAAAALAMEPHALALVADRAQMDFLTAAVVRGLHPVERGRVEGFNYSRGKPVTLTAYGVEDRP